MESTALVTNLKLLSFSILSLTLSVHPLVGVYLNASGFEHCIFQLLEYRQNATILSSDLIENILVKSQGNQAWSVAQLDFNKHKASSDSTVWFHRRRPYLKLYCTIIILVVAEHCSELNILENNLVLLEENILITIVSQATEGCQNESMNSDFDSFHKLFLSKEGKISSAYSYCPTCSEQYGKSQLTNVVGLNIVLEFQNFLSHIRKKSMETYIAMFTTNSVLRSASAKLAEKNVKPYIFLYPNRNQGLRKLLRIGPYTNHIFMENAASFLNASLEYYDPHVVGNMLTFQGQKHFSAVAVPLQLRLSNYWAVLPYHKYTVILVKRDTASWFYCVHEDKREGFNFMFWLVPLDPWSWVGLGISCVILTITLRGQWFQIHSILMRQPCTILDKHKVLIMFILVTIIFTYGYEGVISSWITAPPPIVIFKSLRNLLDQGYKLIMLSPKLADPELNAAFVLENISLTTIKSSMVPNSQNLNSYEAYNSFAQFNTTTLIPSKTVEAYKELIHSIFPGTKCHATTGISKIVQTNWFFSGHLKHELYKFGCSMLECGILNMIHKYHCYMSSLLVSSRRRKQILMEELKSRESPFEISDMKILSIFFIWGFLLTIAFVTFLLEMASKSLKRQVENIGAVWGLERRGEIPIYILRSISIFLSCITHRAFTKYKENEL